MTGDLTSARRDLTSARRYLTSARRDLQERTKDNSKESETFREHLAVRTAEYVEEMLSPHFGGLMQFVRDAEAMVERGDSEALRREERESMGWDGMGWDGMGDGRLLRERGDGESWDNEIARVECRLWAS